MRLDVVNDDSVTGVYGAQCTVDQRLTRLQYGKQLMGGVVLRHRDETFTGQERAGSKIQTTI